jgi:hypothetical protein
MGEALMDAEAGQWRGALGWVERIRANRWAAALFVGSVAVWFGAWMWLMRYHQLDDAFITLRYAQHLAESGELAFNPHVESRGASSLLYTYVVALAYRLDNSSLDTKLLSIIFYAALLAATGFRWLRAKSALTGSLWLSLLIVLLSPMSVRWLSDGMDTSLYVLAAYVIGTVTAGDWPQKRSWPRSVLLVLLGAVAVVIRVEAGLLVACATLGMLLQRVEARRGLDAPGWLTAEALWGAPLALGSALACIAVALMFGSLLPDTAAAKSHYADAFTIRYLGHLAVSMASTFTMGAGLLVLAAGSAVLALAAESGLGKLAILAGDAPFPALVLAAWSRGEEGMFRYFIASLVFAIAWNVASLERRSSVVVVRYERPARRWLAAFAVVLLVLFLPEGVCVYRIGASRSQSYLAMRRQHLELLASETGVAGDVGMIGYFSQASICDLDGLVGGRDWARKPPDERVRLCATRSPFFVFANSAQADELRQYLDFHSLTPCYDYPLPNVSTQDTHILYVDRRLAPTVCR